MKTFSTYQIKEIALRYAYDNRKLNNTNVSCFIAGFSKAQGLCKEPLLEVLNKEVEQEKKFPERYKEMLGYSGYMYNRPSDYEETLRNHKKYLDALENLISIIKETKILCTE